MLGGRDGIAEGRVHDDDAALARRWYVDRVDADAGASDHLQAGQRGVHCRTIDPGRAANSDAVITTDDFLELVGREARFLIDLNTALTEDGGGARVHLVGDEDLDGVGHALASHAQSSHGASASISEVSTVAPHQIRRPGGASRYAPMS